MIGSITGKILLKNDKFLVVEAGGVGYKIMPSLDVLEKANENDSIHLWVHTHIREDAFDLYGFAQVQDLDIFEKLISVSGIGPKGAIAILGIAGREKLVQSITSNNVSYLTQVSGIGKKTAEKIVLELRDKVKGVSTDTDLSEETEALEALKALGYSHNVAREALKGVKSGDINTRIKAALKILANK